MQSADRQQTAGSKASASLRWAGIADQRGGSPSPVVYGHAGFLTQ
jgi:hypothetical protein